MFILKTELEIVENVVFGERYGDWRFKKSSLNKEGYHHIRVEMCSNGEGFDLPNYSALYELKSELKDFDVKEYKKFINGYLIEFRKIKIGIYNQVKQWLKVNTK